MQEVKQPQKVLRVSVCVPERVCVCVCRQQKDETHKHPLLSSPISFPPFPSPFPSSPLPSFSCLLCSSLLLLFLSFLFQCFSPRLFFSRPLTDIPDFQVLVGRLNLITGGGRQTSCCCLSEEGPPAFSREAPHSFTASSCWREHLHFCLC